MELFLAKLVGLYLLIMGVMVLVRKKSMMPTVTELMKNRALLLVLAAVELAAGLALVLAYPTVEVSIAGMLALIGYMMVIESIIYVALPLKEVRKMVEHFNRPSWYVGGGLASIALGAYLAGIALGFIQ